MLNKTESTAEILVVDDIPANLKVLSEVLSAADYGVAAVTSGKRALKRLQNYLPDLVLLDIKMPDMDGFETCRQIKENPQTAHIPIMFITALSDVDNIAQGFSLGAVDYVCKPFQELELLARVDTHLKLQDCTRRLKQQVAEQTAELQKALEHLEQSKLQLIQQEKMSALGNLVAGVAHEVNNPLGFLNGSITNAKDYLKDLLGHLNLYQEYATNLPNVVAENAEDIDLDFLCEDFPTLLDSMQTASDRIRAISKSLRIFSRTDTESKVKANIHEGLDSTILILKYRLKAKDFRPKIEVICHYGELPEVDCFPGQLNQVFMNLLANAIDMFDEVAGDCSYEELKENPQQITIRTRLVDDENIEICISDNGKGMSEEVCAKIFNRKFTTKAVGKGTGLGLAIAHQVITEKHGGELEVKSRVGNGTEFMIHLPL